MPGVVLRYAARYTVGESNTDAALKFTGASEKGLPWELKRRQYWENCIGAAGREREEEKIESVGLKKFFWY